MIMKKIQDLKPHEAIEIRTTKEAKKLNELAGITFAEKGNYLISQSRNWFASVSGLGKEITIIYPASYFLPKKKKWKKEAFSEIARLDSEVNELRHMLAKDIPVNVSEDVKLEVGKWYTDNFEQLFFITNIDGYCITGYGFSGRGWNNETNWYSGNIEHAKKLLKPATPEEVKSALIKEAISRGHKEGCKVDRKGITEGVDYICVITPECQKWLYHAPEDSLELYGFIIYEKGKWAEILEQPKEIDWSVPGQLVKSTQSQLILLTTGKNNTQKNFEGVVVFSRSYFIGYTSNIWNCKSFKPYTGEPIILKP